MSNQAPLMPTFRGHISTTMDALVLFECCLHGRLNHVPRRPHDRERQDLISSGNIFIYEEHASGIKRWTDGVSWSPSRILGNFLIYRELDKPFPPGEKKRALKKKKTNNQGITKPDIRNNTAFSAAGMDPAHIKDPERSLVGSLVDSYPFKKSGLIKKTISITYQGVPHHLVSYYNVEEVLQGSLVTPSTYHMFSDVQPRPELLMSQNFRNPLDEAAIFGQEERGLLPISAANFYTLAAPVQDLSPHGVVMTQPMPVQSMPSHQPMPSYPTGLDYEFFQVQQQAAHHHPQLPHHAHHQQQPQQPQQQHHHYQYQQHHHQLQQPHHQHEDHQNHYHEMQQPLQHHQSPQDQAKQEQQQPPAGTFMPQGGPWGYDPNDSYYFG